MSTLVQRAKRMRLRWPDVYGILSIGEAVEVLRKMESRTERHDAYYCKRRIRFEGYGWLNDRDAT